jgi:hypothetical protein
MSDQTLITHKRRLTMIQNGSGMVRDGMLKHNHEQKTYNIRCYIVLFVNILSTTRI